MAEFVVYHSPERMGYSAETVRGFSILTNKNVPSVVGSRVWLLMGEGTPRTYYLRGHFTPTRRTRTEESGFAWLVVTGGARHTRHSRTRDRAATSAAIAVSRPD